MRPTKRYYLLKCLSVFFILGWLLSCSSSLELSIKERSKLKKVASASGIAVQNDIIFVIGDDVPWLYVIESDFSVTAKIPFGDYNLQKDSVIAKPQKPDLEALAVSKPGSLFAFGSGSLPPHRDILIQFTDQGAWHAKTYSLQKFYRNIRSLPDLKETPLNIEAAAVSQQKLFLLNRENNLLLKINLTQALAVIRGKKADLDIVTYHLQLPTIKGIETGFSGAHIIPRTGILLFTASVEDTPNPVDDGEILGSFIGKIELDELENEARPLTVPIADGSGPLKIKAESIAVLDHANNAAEVLFVTDSDGGASEIFKAKLNW